MTTVTAAGPTPALMKAINAAFNSRDVDRIMEFFAEDCTFLMARGPEPEGRRVHGKAAVRKVLADRFKVIADMRWDHVDQIIAGPRAVTVWMVTGRGADRSDRTMFTDSAAAAIVRAIQPATASGSISHP